MPCADRALGPSPARPAGCGPLHNFAGPGRAWAENNLNTSGLGRAWAQCERAGPGRAGPGPETCGPGLGQTFTVWIGPGPGLGLNSSLRAWAGPGLKNNCGLGPGLDSNS